MTTIHLGDCLDVLPTIDECSIDAVVTDPPYGLGFMGKEWDHFASRNFTPDELRKRGATEGSYDHTRGRLRSGSMHAGEYDLRRNSEFQTWCEMWSAEVLRVLKPGGHLLAFGGTRTAHRLASGIEDAGFEIRDSIEWLYGSGFPKSLNLDGEFEGWGTALKPGHEPVIVGRKPLAGTVLANMERFGVGAINIDGCRIEGDKGSGNWSGMDRSSKPTFINSETHGSFEGEAHELGRWPANVVMSHSADCTESRCEDDCPVVVLDRQSGTLTSGANPTRRGTDKGRDVFGEFAGQEEATAHRGKDVGGASRFFYVAKAGRRERDLGLDDLDERPLLWSSGTKNPGSFQSEGTRKLARNHHPTVKPIDLMRHLVRLVTPRGGALLDPFCGSGTTGVAAVLEGARFIGIEREPDYVEIARRRIEHFALAAPIVEDRRPPERPGPTQGALL